MTDSLALRAVTESPDDAAVDREDTALARLMPAIERYRRTERTSFPVYRSGIVPSEPGPLPEEGAGLDATLDELGLAIESGCRVAAPGFFGFITTGASTSAVAAHTAVAVAGGQRYGLHSFNALELTGLRWLAEVCGLPAGTPGVFSSGGSTANLVALGVARQAAFELRGIDVANDGLPTGVECRVYASARAHRTINRSAAVLGLGRRSVVEIPTDRDDRVDLRALEAALREDTRRGMIPVATVAIAGSTDTGVVDPVADVIDIGRRHGSWIHVDGAYGLIANASAELRPLFAGVTDADSWIVDPHKWLATGLGVGATFVRDEPLLTRAFAEGEAAYLEGSFARHEHPPESQFDVLGGPWADQGVELSSPPRGVLVWAILREIGRSGVARRVERHVGFARRVAARARAEERLELLLEPMLSIACFRYVPSGAADPDALNVALLDRLRRETPFMPTSTRVRGQFAIRPCFINPRSTEADVDGMVDEVLRLGRELDR
jgi:aromatic-L-amino-acid/L-tryptophan decarboxylase